MSKIIEKPFQRALIDLISRFETQTPNHEGLNVYHIRFAFLGKKSGLTDKVTLEKIKEFFDDDINKQLLDYWKQKHNLYLSKGINLLPNNLSNHLKRLHDEDFIELCGKRPDNVRVKLVEK